MVVNGAVVGAEVATTEEAAVVVMGGWEVVDVVVVGMMGAGGDEVVVMVMEVAEAGEVAMEVAKVAVALEGFVDSVECKKSKLYPTPIATLRHWRTTSHLQRSKRENRRQRGRGNRIG